MLVAHLLAAAERLEDRAAGKLVGPVAEHRPVRDLARRRAPGADGVEQAGRPTRGERVEVRRRSGFVAGAAAEHLVRPVGEPVEQEDDDRIHAARRLTRAVCPQGALPVLTTTVRLKPSR